MANWYYGVLKLVKMYGLAITFADRLYSTGKRRYGHPALTGQLPQPWLPLKKGQTLANYVDRDEEGGDGKYSFANDAVVLTLRRKPSRAARRRSMGIPLTDSAAASGQPNDPLPAADVGGTASGTATPNNPWKDLRPSPASSATNIRRRLSFDRATGVIMLPEEDLYGDEIDSSEEEGAYHSSSSDDLEDERGAGDAVNAGADGAGSSSMPRSAVGSPTSASKRHSTYYHHPERSRKKMMPGAFTM